MKKTILFLTLTFIVSFSFAQFWCPIEKRNHNVNKTLRQILNYPEFKTASFAFYAIDINTGEIIAKINPDMALKPASTLKLLSTATILELYEPDYQFETTLSYIGKIDTVNNVLIGDIIIEGGGDPTLGSKYFDETKEKQFLSDWNNAIVDLSIDSITGGVIADASFYTWDIVPPSWSWLNMGNYYGAGATGLSVFDNYYSVFFNTGDIIGDTVEIVKTIPNIPNIIFDNTITADSISYDNSYIFGAPYSYTRQLRGQLPVSEIDFAVKGSIPDPAIIVALQADSAIKAKNIVINNQPTTIRLLSKDKRVEDNNRITIYTTKSPALYEIIAQTNIHSINLFAEHCLLHSGLELGALPNPDSSIDSLISYWANKGMDTQGMALHDGSGLSQYNAITPRQMVFLLKYMKLESKYFDTYYNSMAIAGETGTLKNMFKGSLAEGKLRAKSGTVSRVKAYSGYVTSKSGRDIAFSMIVNNFSCKSSEAKAKLEELMIALSEFNK